MSLSETIKPISYLKSHASELIRNISRSRKTFIITQNGEAKAVLQDIKEYEKTRESLALLKILALSNKNFNEGNVTPLKKAFTTLDEKIKADENQ